MVLRRVHIDIDSPVHMHNDYKFERTWLAPLTLSISVAIHPQSGRVYEICFGVQKLENYEALTCWVAAIRFGAE